MQVFQWEFIYEHSFISELDLIEPCPYRQTYLLMRIEIACAEQIRTGIQGSAFVRVKWERDLLAWFQPTGSTVSLLSIRYDDIALDKVA